MIKPVKNFGQLIDKAGQTRQQFATAADVAVGTLQRLCKPAGPVRIHGPNAWKIARTWAQLLNVTEDEAFTTLFEEE